MKFTCELRRIENPNEQQLGSKPARLITSPGRRILLFLGNFTRCSLNTQWNHFYIGWARLSVSFALIRLVCQMFARRLPVALCTALHRVGEGPETVLWTIRMEHLTKSIV
ncbi:hypothetical protein SFRURICE_001973 [Spodoptera frugiperda]|nr:hypothetical protein SFRURICE_001973 [Spodoptera frugiperda]